MARTSQPHVSVDHRAFCIRFYSRNIRNALSALSCYLHVLVSRVTKIIVKYLKPLCTVRHLHGFLFLFRLQCLIAGWYISCLLQFLVIGTVVMYVRVKNRKFGIYLIATLLVASLITPFVMTYMNRAYGIIRLMVSWVDLQKKKRVIISHCVHRSSLLRQ